MALAPFDAAACLSETEDQHALLAKAFASGDAGFIVHALGASDAGLGMSEADNLAVVAAR
ncbi:hypothetical protein [Sphingomonas morindae]|uniref:Uncharacterized protein n=1 Tax=Sphingomonas morindae TaxID=1541170 RepID=A0ABY4X3K6_9SPHN|nr:hypothetical protein [Sphingomonas morindae]USI71456.1 hypothetical protein LHA26_08875 [Sphingomonas morindae]